MKTPAQTSDDLKRAFSGLVTDSLKALLETRHLYQTIHIGYTEVLSAHLPPEPVPAPYEGIKGQALQLLILTPWRVVDDVRRLVGDSPTLPDKRLVVRAPDVKLYCTHCESREAFNPAGAHEMAQDVRDNAVTQVLALTFLCQSCKRIPEAFLVRREALKLTLAGRAPIERVLVPSDIPKAVRGFYSGAIVAYQSGQALAGVFMLRTVIEQFLRSIAPDPSMAADALCDWYMGTLSTEFKARFPSLKHLYSRLSEAVHQAKADEALFEEVRERIDLHFSARALYSRGASPAA